MSQCQAVNCELYSSSETKDFNGCNILQSLPIPICNIGPSSPTQSTPTCTKRSDVTATNLIRATTECSIPDDTNPSIAQILCEEKTGCTWGYQGGTEQPIKKICKPKGETLYTCEDSFSDTLIDDKPSRYGLVDPKTFGCDAINCEYTPVSKSIVVGQCIENTDTDSVSSTPSTIDCATWTTKTQCLDTTLGDKCIWNANDESYCGYNRNIEKYIEDINSQPGVSINNINEITGTDITGNIDPCKRIQNPSRENCEMHGCLWDIYGNRIDNHQYNQKTNADGLVVVDINYYDINTTGLCTSPVTEKCMDYFCGRSTFSSNVNKLDDGICKKETGDETCSPSDKHIITDKTPGFITFLPTGSMYPNHLSRANWGHTSEQEDNITNFNKLLGLQYNATKAETGDEDKVLTPFRKHYKDNCEKNLLYPTSDTITGSYEISKNKKQYDEDTDICMNSNPAETVSTNAMTDHTLCDSFYHKDKSGTYTISNSCEVISNADINVSDVRHTVSLSLDGDILPHTLHGFTNDQSAPSSSASIITGIRAANDAVISANLVCNRKFLEIITLIREILINWDTNFYYLGTQLNSGSDSIDGIVNLGTGSDNRNIDIVPAVYTEIHETLLGDFGRGSPMIPNPLSTNTDYYPITERGAGLILNSLIYRANVIDIATDTNLTDFKSALTVLFGVATQVADNESRYDWIPNNGKISTPDIKTRIEARILNIANKVQFGLISYDEYKEELSRFIASLLVYTGSGDDSSVKCAYDTFNNTYSSYTSDGGTMAINTNNIILEALNDHLQVKAGDQGAESTAINYYDLIGNSVVGETSLSENISTTHSIKDIVHRKGTAILTFQLYDGSDNKIEMTEGIKNGFFDTKDSIYFEKTTVSARSSSPPTESLKITQGDGNDETIFDITDDDTNVYTIKDGPNIYVGGILEIEVDNIEPGCLGDLISGSNTCQSNIYMINSNGDYTSTISDNKLSLKEIRLKDNPIDIYFNGDIDGLYRINEIISINGLENNTFNNNLSFDSTNYYQIISDIDTINNKITIKNGTRKGEYFLGREDLETNHYKDPGFCRNVSYGGGMDTPATTDAVSALTKCDTIHEIYKHCKGHNDSSDCTVDDLCVYNDTTSTCLPIQPNSLIDHTSNTKCYEIDENMVDSNVKPTANMKPTKCHYDYGNNNFSYEFKPFYKNSSGGDIDTSESALTITAPDNFYILYEIAGVYQSAFFYNWRIEYLDVTSGEKIIGRIDTHLYIPAPTSEGVSSNGIKIKKIIGQDTEVEEEGNIFILSIRPPKNVGTGAPSSATQFDKPSIVTINSYLKKEVSIEDGAPTYTDTTNVITNKSMCDFNNGKWNNRKCVSSGDDNVFRSIRGVDVCENTGYIFDQTSNLCFKEYNSSDNIDGSTFTYNHYCTNKTLKAGENGGTSVNWDTNNRNNTSTDEYKKPCSVCSFVLDGSTNNHHCKALSKLDCLRMEDDKCGIARGTSAERPGTGGILSTKTACEFYRHNANHENVTIGGTEKQVRFADFVCEQNDSVDSSACNTHQRLEECESSNPNNPTGCQWKCPYVSDDIPGYEVKLNDDTSPRLTSLADRQDTLNYYSRADFVVTCKDGWEQITGEIPRAQCIQNPDSNTRNNHGEIISYLGCVKSLNCKNDIYTSETINNLDPTMIPNEFKTNGLLDPSKIPTENGSFQCPLPKSLKSNPEGTPGWSEELCCQNIGLCSGNDITSNDVSCPTGQLIKQTYYGESDVLQPFIGTSITECCEAPEAPTITQVIELTNAIGNITSANSSESEEFRSNFIQDLLSILNHPDSGIGFTVTADMISILDIIEPLGNNIEVTFKILKNTDGNVVNRENLTRLLVPGTTFTRVGGIANTSPHFRPYDPKARYLYYSDKFKRGVTIEEVGISIFVTLSLCLFCLVILGIVLK
jgi:hypothetical protein